MEEEEEQVSWSEGYTLRAMCVCVCVCDLRLQLDVELLQLLLVFLLQLFQGQFSLDADGRARVVQ